MNLTKLKLNIERYIKIKNFILLLMGFSFIFVITGNLFTANVLMFFAMISLVYYEKLKGDIYEEE